MTEQDVAKVLAYAISCGREIERSDALCFLRAKELLAADPNHVAARSVVETTMHFFSTGEATTDFYKFTLGDCSTVEERVAHDKSQRHPAE
jgi:hypothetical protein